jgi:hypothetical protein
VALALLGHGAFALFRMQRFHRAANPALLLDVDALQLGLEEEGPRDPGPPPGGGSPETDPTGHTSAPEQPLPAPKHAPRVLRAAALKVRDSANEDATEGGDPDPPLPAADLLAGEEGDDVAAVKPRAARRQLLATPGTDSATAPDAATQVAANSDALGEGFGANGGPGGLGRGRGSGVIGKAFTFGGPKGAFRADVCFIEPSVKRLADIQSCSTVATFFTDALAVSPRRFSEGFPGLGDRKEWFAIKYRGKFKVAEADYYTFRLLSDDGATLHIDGYPILDNDGQHMPRSVQSTITLEAGEHEFSVYYYQGPPDFIALELFVKRFEHGERLFGPVL